MARQAWRPAGACQLIPCSRLCCVVLRELLEHMSQRSPPRRSLGRKVIQLRVGFVNRVFVLLTAALATLGGVACDRGAGITDPPLSELEGAPSRVQIAGSELKLETYLWRDFMPTAPPNGTPLIAVLRIVTTGTTGIPEGLKAEQVSITYQGEIWTAAVKQEHPSTEPRVLEVVARNGPKWGPGVNVDVVVRLREGRGPTYWLRAADQPIHRTD